MIWHSSSLTDIIEELQTDLEYGLSDAIASLRHKDFGDNFSPTTSVSPFIDKVVRQFKRPINIVLISASLLFLIIEWLMPAFGGNHIAISISILLITMLFCIFRATKSYICEKYIADRQKEIAPKAIVIRGGIQKIIESSKLVPGDLIVLKPGVSVAADARLISSENLSCNEVATTSVNIPVIKDASFICTDITPMSQRSNMVFAGSWVAHGNGLAVVTEIADDTEYGKQISIERKPALAEINTNLNSVKIALNQFVPVITAIIFIIMFIIMRFSEGGDNLTLLSIFVHCGLVASVCAALISSSRITNITHSVTAIGIKRLKEQHITVTNANVINTLGKINCFCIDKSAITGHDMTATQFFSGNEMFDLRSSITSEIVMALRLAAAASKVDGDSNDRAIIQACFDYTKIDKSEVDNLYPQLSSLSFDNSEMITVSVNMIDGQPYAIIKGAAESISRRCNVEQASIISNADAMGAQALHVVAVAMKQLSSISDTVNPSKEELENGCTFLGLIGFTDQLRPDTRKTVAECADAGIKVVMFTGDSLSTAKAIARQAGILSDDLQAITGVDLEQLNQFEFEEAINRCTTFARITPDLRIKIIQALKDCGNVVAATGRTPQMCAAMDTADIGCAMANSGSDAVKRSADIIVDNDSFISMINIVKSGRNIFENVRNSMHTILSINIALIIIELFGYFIWQTALLTPAQMLLTAFLVNFLSTTLISFEPYSKLTKISKRFRYDKCFDQGQKIDIAWQSSLIAAVSVIVYAIERSIGADVANLCTIITYTAASLLMIYSLKSRKSILTLGLLDNVICLIVVALIVVLLFICVNMAFLGAGAVSGGSITTMLLFSFVPFVATEICKIIKISTNKE